LLAGGAEVGDSDQALAGLGLVEKPGARSWRPSRQGTGPDPGGRMGRAAVGDDNRLGLGWGEAEDEPHAVLRGAIQGVGTVKVLAEPAPGPLSLG
jgi:hypothetical protein